MTRRVTDLDYLEQQLHEVEGRLKEAVVLLTNLKTVQAKFKDLATYYKETKAGIEHAQEDLEALKGSFQDAIQGAEAQLGTVEKRFLAYEKKSETRLQKLYTDSATLLTNTGKQVDALVHTNTQQTQSLLTTTEEQLDALVQANAEQAQALLTQSQMLLKTTQEQVQGLTTDVARQQEQLAAQFETLSGHLQGRVDTLTYEVDARSHRLQTEFDAFQVGLRAELKTAEDNLQAAFRNLRGDLERDASVLRGDVEKRLGTYRAELEGATRLMQQSLDEALASFAGVKTRFDRFHDELQTAARKHEGLESRVVKLRAEVTPLDQRITGTQEAFQKTSQHLADTVKKQASQLRTLTIVAFLALLVAIAAVALPLLTK